MSEQDYIQLTLFQGDSHANRFPWLESKKEKGTTVIYGRKCSELSESLRQVGLSVRMYLESCELPGKQFVRTWSVRDTLSPFLILKLRLSERRTDEKECSLSESVPLWKTPVTADANNREFYRNSRGEPNLSAQVKVAPNGPPPRCQKMWPSPVASGKLNGGTRDFNKLQALKEGILPKELSSIEEVPEYYMKFWPTATARDYKGARKPETLARAGRNPSNSLPDAVMSTLLPTPRAGRAGRVCKEYNKDMGADSEVTMAKLDSSTIGGQLNPTWVEWLMGFPIGYTEVE